MTTKEQLIGLLFQIRGATSTLEKLKLAALAWRTLRGLDGHEKLVVAKELGLGGAESLVDQLGRAGGLSPAALLAAIRRAEEAEPEDLRELLGGVMDPERRDELLAGALRSAGDWLAEQEGLPPVPGADEEAGFEIGVPDPKTPEAGTGSATATAAGAAAGAAAAAGVTATTTDSVTATEPVTATDTAAEPVTVTVPATVTVTPGTETAAAQRAGLHNPKTPGHQDPKTSRPQDPKTQATAQNLDAESTIFSALESCSSGVARLRLLASHEHGVADLNVDQLVEVVESFPVGWSRRRALEALLRRGLPRGLEDAMELVRRVADDGSRLWAVTALAGRSDLTETEKQIIEEYVKGVPVVERRVALRLGRRRLRA